MTKREKKLGDWVSKKFKTGTRIGEVIEILNDKNLPNSTFFYRCRVRWDFENENPISARETTSQAYSLQIVDKPS